MTPVSAVIITFNEAAHIGRCIDSVRNIADEILVLDSFSTDQTVAIARSKGAVVKQYPFLGYREQKNLAKKLAAFDLVLSLDADEELDATLQQSIMEARRTHEGNLAYSMNRCAIFWGEPVKYGSWYPDRKLRLFDRRMASWGGINPHDKIELEPGTRVRHLSGDILHYSFHSVTDQVNQNNRFSSISAQSLQEAGKSFTWFRLLINPFWAFINGYFLRLGFLNGIMGFSIAVNAAHQTFLKYVKLYELELSQSSEQSGTHSEPLISASDARVITKNPAA